MHPAAPHRLSRRHTLRQLARLGLGTLLGSGLSACGTTPGDTASSASPLWATPLTDHDVRLVERLTWGSNDGELARLAQQGSTAWLQQQLLAPAAAPTLPAPVAQRIAGYAIERQPLLALATDLQQQRQRIDALPDETTRQPGRKALNEQMGQLAHEAASRHVFRALYSPRPVHERLTWFWLNHFNVYQHKGAIRALVGHYEDQAIRPHALGPFRQLLGAVVHHPAMLTYLDNQQNAVGKVNENLARELMELHTLGVDAGYTQRDVQELARILTGHGERQPDAPPPKLRKELAGLYVEDGLYAFHPNRHDFGDKVWLGRTIKGRGATELDEVLDVLATHPATARFVCGKLARHFGPDQPDASLLRQMEATFLRTNGHIGQTLHAMATHPAFLNPTARHFKDPVHHVFSAVRAAYDQRPIVNPRPILNWVNRMAEGLYNRQTPDGYPQDSSAWNSPGQLSTRFDVARAIGSGTAGLFKGDEPGAMEAPAFPQLARPTYYQHVQARLSPATRQALDQAGSLQDWNTLYLSAPEFMWT